jgi:hypothetical protein
MIVPFIPSVSWRAQMYGYVPGCVNVIRNRVVEVGDCGSPI